MATDTVGYIIPVYNESAILREELLSLADFLGDLEPDYEIIVIENGSRDDTKDILMSMADENDFLTAHSLPNADYGGALRAGIERTPHERNFLLNIDWWDQQFIETGLKDLEDHDLVVGSKRLGVSTDNRSPYRKLLSWGLNFLLWLLVGFQGTETHGLKAFRKSGLAGIIDRCEMKRGMFDTEVVVRARKEGLRVVERAVRLRDDRPPRNWMIQKIAQNVYDIVWLTYVIRRDYGFE